MLEHHGHPCEEPYDEQNEEMLQELEDLRDANFVLKEKIDELGGQINEKVLDENYKLELQVSYLKDCLKDVRKMAEHEAPYETIIGYFDNCLPEAK